MQPGRIGACPVSVSLQTHSLPHWCLFPCEAQVGPGPHGQVSPQELVLFGFKYQETLCKAKQTWSECIPPSQGLSSVLQSESTLQSCLDSSLLGSAASCPSALSLRRHCCSLPGSLLVLLSHLSFLSMKTSLLLTFVFLVKRLWAGERVFAGVLLSGRACALFQEVPPFQDILCSCL